MATRIEDGVEFVLHDAVEANGLAELSFRIPILLEPDRKLGPEVGLVALGILRRAAALRGCERDVNASILEDVIRSCQLFEPEARLPSSVTEFIVRRDNHQHFHDQFLYCQ